MTKPSSSGLNNGVVKVMVWFGVTILLQTAGVQIRQASSSSKKEKRAEAESKRINQTTI